MREAPCTYKQLYDFQEGIGFVSFDNVSHAHVTVSPVKKLKPELCPHDFSELLQ